MIRIYCDDLSLRPRVQHYFRELGFEAASLPYLDFLQEVNRPDTGAAILIRPFPPGLNAYVDRRIPVLTVGRGTVGNSEDSTGIPFGETDFVSYDDPSLLETLYRLDCLPPDPCFRDILVCDDFGVVYLGYRAELTPAEIAVVRFLLNCRASGRRSGIPELLEYCVGDLYRSPENVVQHISSVNAKLRRIGSRTVITRDEDGRYYIGDDI